MGVRQHNYFRVLYMINQSPTSPNTFYFISPWRHRASINTSMSMSGSRSFVVNDRGVVGHNTFISYNPSTNSWSYSQGVNQPTYYSSPWVINDEAFILIRGGETVPVNFYIYKYLPDNSSNTWNYWGWNLLPNYITKGFTTAVAQNRAFLLTGNPHNLSAPNFFEVVPADNHWEPAPQFPGGILEYAFAMEINGMAHFGTGLQNGHPSDVFYRYNPSTQNWTQLADFPVKSYNGIGFSINGIGYAGIGNKKVNQEDFDKSIYSFNPELNSWKWVANFPNVPSWLEIRDAFAFTIGNVAYVGIANHSSYNFFEFDPAYLKENYQHNK